MSRAPRRPDHAYDVHAPLRLGAAGDVASARGVARALLGARAPDFRGPEMSLLTLVLTALCLHATHLRGEAASEDDVAGCLTDLMHGDGPAVLRSSPMQLVGYATAELEALDRDDADHLLSVLMGVLATAEMLRPERPSDKTTA